MEHMARVAIGSERLQRLIFEHLVPGVIVSGSVRELSRRLNEVLASRGHAGAIHPNRLHALLSDDSSQSVNDSTVAMLESALPHVALGAGLDDAIVQLAEKVTARWWATHQRAQDIARV